MKELDLLLSCYVRERYRSATAGEQAGFEILLALPDPEIADYLLGHGTPTDPQLAAAIRAVLHNPSHPA